MRLLRRNTVTFEYRPYVGETERRPDGLHTGDMKAEYDSPVTYRGNIAPATGDAETALYGLDVRYSHILLMDKVDADISEDGLIEWNGNQYDIVAVRRSLNVLSAALLQRTRNHAVG